jgi:DNA-binding LacI/PurR family transcriptional regulator
MSPVARLSETAVLALVRDRIESGVYAPGVRMPAERALAAEFGVTRGVVRNVYSRLTDQGLIEQSHYRRPHVPLNASTTRRMASTEPKQPDIQVRTIAAVFPSDPTFPGGLSVIAGIHKALADVDAPYRLTFHDTYHKNRPQVLGLEELAIRSAIEDNVGGIIWWHFTPDEFVSDVVKTNPDLPIVFIDRYPNVDCDFAGLDDIEGTKSAVEYLLDLGHTRIAHIMDPGNFSTVLERAQGYREAFISRGMPVPEELVFHLDWSDDPAKVTNTLEALEYLFARNDPPTAISTSNDYIAHRLIKIARSKGIRVPEDLSIVGQGNTDRYSQNPFLTSVDQPFDAIGRAGAKLLLKRLNAGVRRHTYQRVILPTDLVVRDSCRPLT